MPNSISDIVFLSKNIAYKLHMYLTFLKLITQNWKQILMCVKTITNSISTKNYW